MRRVISAGETVYFICNANESPQCVHIDARTGRTLARLDPFDALLTPTPFFEDGWVCLSPNESLLLLETEETLSKQQRPKELAVSMPLECVDIKPLQFNALPLDMGELQVAGTAFRDLYAPYACEEAYRANGFESNPWYMAIQYRDEWIRRNQFSKGTGLRYTCRFHLDYLPKKLMMAYESRDVFRLSINGRHTDNPMPEKWLGELNVAEISRLCTLGENRATLSCERFDIIAELNPLYLLGEFSVASPERLNVQRPRMLAHGDLTALGLPFYCGRVRYRYRFMLDEAMEGGLLGVPAYTGTALSAYINGVLIGQSFSHNGEELPFEAPMYPGWNEVVLELSCSLRNLFGPHHTEAPLRNSAWPNAWRQVAPRGSVPVSRYDCVAYGLSAPPVLRLCHLHKQ